jgi:hypothetical protein
VNKSRFYFHIRTANFSLRMYETPFSHHQWREIFGNKITNSTSICSTVEIWRDAFVYCMMKTDQYAQMVYDKVIGHKFFTIGTGVHKNYNILQWEHLMLFIDNK